MIGTRRLLFAVRILVPLVLLTSSLPLCADEASTPATEEASDSVPSADEPSSELSLEFVPPNPELFIAIRPSDLFDRRLLKAFQRYLSLGRGHSHPVSMTQIEQVTWVKERRDPGDKSNVSLIFDLNIIRTMEPVDWDDIVANANFDYEAIEHEGETYYKLLGISNVSIWTPNELTYIAGPDDSIRQAIERANAEPADLVVRSAWPAVGRSQLAIVLVSDALEERLENVVTRAKDGRAMAMGAVKTLVKDSETFIMALHMDGSSPLPMNMRMIVGCPNEELVAEKLKSLGAINFLLKQLIISEQKAREESGANKRVPTIADAGASLFDHTTREQVGNAAVLKISADVPTGNAVGFLISLLGDAAGIERTVLAARELDLATLPEEPEVKSAIPPGILNSPRMVARRQASAQQMEKIYTAIREYVTTHGHAPRCSYDDQQRPLLSWRVHLLPALGYAELYEQFHLDEPWDSEHNRPLLEKMPAVYGRPQTDASENAEPHAVMFVAVRDGADSASDKIESECVLFVEARREVPWTKPDEISVNEQGQPLDDIQGWHPGGIMVCLGDGSTQFVLAKEKATLRFGSVASGTAAE